MTGSRHNDRQARDHRALASDARTREAFCGGCPSNSWASVTCSNFEGKHLAWPVRTAHLRRFGVTCDCYVTAAPTVSAITAPRVPSGFSGPTVESRAV